MLDTCVCVEVMRYDNASVRRHLSNVDVSQLYLSSITYAELYFGVQKSGRNKEQSKLLGEFVSPLTVLPFDRSAAEDYGRLRQDLSSRGQMIGAMDMLIAAHALSVNAVMVTNNLREFERVDGLRVEDWT